MKKHNLLLNLGLIFLLLFCPAFACQNGGNEANKTIVLQSGAPSEETVKQLLRDKFISNQYATRKETLEFESIDFYKSNQGVYPVRVKCTRVIKDSDGTGKKFAMDGLFHFLKNESGEWTFNVQEWYRNEQI